MISYKMRLIVIFLSSYIYAVNAVTRERVVIMTDFPPVDVIPGILGYGAPEKCSDPDDVQSMVRFLLYADCFDIEGLIATSATFANVANKKNLYDILYLYDHVYENLSKHSNDYPSANKLRNITWEGYSGTWGRSVTDIIGTGKDSEASENIITLLEKEDERPVWFCIWGGSGDLAQAIWRINNFEDRAKADRLLKKIRIYMIGLQDGSGQWLLDTFPELMIIMSKGNYMGMFNNSNPDEISICDLHWINRNIRKGHGLLGAAYPESGFYIDTPGVWEGDSPSFLYLISAAKGISNSEKPDQESWGGKFIRPDSTKNHWYDHPDGRICVFKWRKQVQDDFAIRADRMIP